ncbi:MAG: glycerophosphodiester phosphodiesterase [Sphingomonadaceae bacterium]
MRDEACAQSIPFMSASLQRMALTLVCAVFLWSCAGNPRLPAFATLDGNRPLVIAHRGASGYLPEETYEAYVKAIEIGADVIEFDLISTKDGVLIARHDPNLASSTDVAKHGEFAYRKKTVQVDGETQTGWFAGDFTLAEIKTLGCISNDAERPQQHNGLYKIVTFEEIIDLAKTRSRDGRVIAIYVETKNPTYHRGLGLPLEDTLIETLDRAGWNSRDAPVFVQSFEPSSLKYMRTRGLKTKLVQLIDANDYDLGAGTITFAPPFDRPYDWTLAGDSRLFSVMVTPAGLAEIKTYADAIGPWKPYIVPVKGTRDASGNMRDMNGDGKVDYADASTQLPTTLVADAHRAGLLVHPYTFRNEARRLAYDYHDDPKAEYLQFYRLGVDGVFSDFPDTALAARADFSKDPSH